MCVKDPRKCRHYTVDIVFTSKMTVEVTAANSEKAKAFVEEEIGDFFPDYELFMRGEYSVNVRDK